MLYCFKDDAQSIVQYYVALSEFDRIYITVHLMYSKGKETGTQIKEYKELSNMNASNFITFSIPSYATTKCNMFLERTVRLL